MAKARGFTLIEVMIAVAIVGILVAIALPNYQNHLRKSRRAEAQAFMTQVAQKEQQYLLDARTYATGGTALADLNLVAPAGVTKYYAIAVEPIAGPPAGFRVRATPSGVQLDDGELTLTHTGQKQRNDPKQGMVDW